MYKIAYKKFSRWMDWSPPGALTSKGWRLFEKEFKEKAPARYWCKHVFYRKHVLPVKWKYRAISDYIRYRTYDKYHVLDTGLPPNYYEIETKMLHVNFNMLKEFIEIEQAWSTYCWSDEYKEHASWAEKHMPFYRRFYPFRRPDLGIKHFEWAATLDDPALPPHERSEQQAKDAREILLLYKWWTVDRPARQEYEHLEYDHQGLGMMAALDDDFDITAPDFKAHQDAMEKSSERNDAWLIEDEEMLIRLIKIRRGLWT